MICDLSDNADTPVAGRLANDALPNFLPRDTTELHNILQLPLSKLKGLSRRQIEHRSLLSHLARSNSQPRQRLNEHPRPKAR